MKEHTKNCASHKNKYDGDARNIYPNEMRDCDCDGYHTFTELYDHRITLYIALCAVQRLFTDKEIWRSLNQSI